MVVDMATQNRKSLHVNWVGGVVFGAILSLMAVGVSVAGSGDATTQPSGQPSGPVLDPAIAAVVSQAVAGQTFQRSAVKGGAFAKLPFDDISNDGVLIGFRIGLGRFFDQDVIKYIAPIYLTPRGVEVGNGYGNLDEVERRAVAKAPPGYAVGAVKVRGGGGLDAITITYMRFNGTRLDPTDIQVTPKVGGDGGGESNLNGDGTPVIGICGREDDKGEWLGIGLIFEKPTATAQAN
jgi:hypothetical protein